MTRLTKFRLPTEVQDLRSRFSDIDSIPLQMESTLDGRIISIEIDDARVIAYLKTKGFNEA